MPCPGKIAADLDISESSVRNIIREFQSGKYPEYNDFVAHVDAIRRLAQETAANGISIGQAIVGTMVFEGLHELRIDPFEISGVIKMLRPCLGSTPPDNFGRALQELAKLQSETGSSFRDLEKLILDKRSETESLKAEECNLVQEIDTLRGQQKQAREDLERVLRKRNTSLQLLDRYEAAEQKFAAVGLAIDDVETAADLLHAAKEGGFVEVAKELAHLESETGKNATSIVDESKRMQETVERSREEEKSFITRIADLRRKEAEQFTQHQVTKERVDRYLWLFDRLKKSGIDLDRD